MRGVQFDGANPEFCEAIHFRAWIGNRPWKHSAERNETIRSCAAILCAPIIYFRRESDNLWRDVVDQPGALHSESVQKCEEGFWIGTIAFNIGVVLAAALHQFMSRRLHHLVRRDVYVNIDNRFQ